jgi:hypothetical protein
MNQQLNEVQIKRYLDEPAEQFRVFDIPYLEKTKKCLDNFKIETEIEYDNYGNNNLQDLKEFLSKIGSNTEEDINLIDKTIKDITQIVMNSVDKKYTHYWLTIRVTLPTKEYDIKRWHCDGNYFRVSNRNDLFKFVTILQGPGTFFLKTTPKQRDIFLSIYNEEWKKSKERNSESNIHPDKDMVYRKALETKLEGLVIQAEKYQAAIFMSSVNTRTTCGIHSEPPKDVPRMFLSIVPCTKEEAENHKNPVDKIKKGGGDGFYGKYLKYKQKYNQLKADLLLRNR